MNTELSELSNIEQIAFGGLMPICLWLSLAVNWALFMIIVANSFHPAAPGPASLSQNICYYVVVNEAQRMKITEDK